MRQRPRSIPGGRSGEGAARSGAGADASPFRSFRRPGAWTLAASITLVVVTGVATLLYGRARGPGPPAQSEIFEALGARPLDAASAGASSGEPGPSTAKAGRFADASVPDVARPALAIVDAIERGHAAGAWSVARKRFDPCPGEDSVRTAWIDSQSRIVKITGASDGAASVVVEQWFDRDGRLRGLSASGATPQPWSVRALLDGAGAVVHRSATGPAPAVDALKLARSDPSRAFFEQPRCEPGKK